MFKISGFLHLKFQKSKIIIDFRAFNSKTTQMKHIIGIRHEDKYLMERRVAISPGDAEKLISKGCKIIVEKSDKRVFSHDEYKNAGASVADDLKDASLIFGVKEIPNKHFEKGKTYVFFSHVIKGQAYNMPMLKQMMELGCNLIDYEKIVDDQDKRLIFFGRFAGLAGAINSLWSFGQRLEAQGTPNIFSSLRQSFQYHSLEEAKDEIIQIGKQIQEQGIPESLLPLVVGITGYGNVSLGAQEIIDLLPVIEISPAELLELKASTASRKHVYKVVFRKHDISKLKAKHANEEFDSQHYTQHPEQYENQFEQYVPNLSMLLNCMYWDHRFPRIVTKDFLETLYSQGEPKLKVIGDITCDPDGSIEATHQGMKIDEPVFVYEPFKRTPQFGFSGNGILIMAVDILPSELPREASLSFSAALSPYIQAIAETDYRQAYDALGLPLPIKKALILHQGELTPPYRYISEFLK